MVATLPVLTAPAQASARMRAGRLRPAASKGSSAGYRTSPKPSPVIERDTPFAHFHRLADGRQQVDLYPVPVFRRVADRWERTSPQKVTAGSGSVAYQAAQAYVPVSFGTNADSVASLALPGGAVAWSAPGLKVGRPKLQGSTVVYPGVAPSTTLTYESSAWGLKEGFELADANAPSSFTMHLSDPSHLLGKPKQAADGGVRFSKEIGDGVGFQLAAPVAYSAPAHDRLPVMTPGSAHLDVKAAGDGFDVTVSLDEAWLKKATYPIVLDPTVSFPNSHGAITDGTVSNGIGGGYSMTTDTYLTTATTDTDIWRTFMRFDLTSIPWRSAVSSATLNLYDTGCSWSCTTNTNTIEVHKMTGAWTTGSTWNQVSPLVDATVQASLNAVPTTVNVWQSFALTNMIQGWINDPATNNGLALKLASEAPGKSGPFWTSSRGTASQVPSLSVTFTSNATHGAPAVGPGASGALQLSADTQGQPTGIPQAPRRSVLELSDGTVINWATPNQQRSYNLVRPPYTSAATAGGSLGLSSPSNMTDSTTDGAHVFMFGCGTVECGGTLAGAQDIGIETWSVNGNALAKTSTTYEPSATGQYGVTMWFDTRNHKLWTAYLGQVLNGTTLESHLLVNSSNNGTGALTSDVDLGKVNNAGGALAAQFVDVGGTQPALLLQDGASLLWYPNTTSANRSPVATVDGSSPTATIWQAAVDGAGRRMLVVSTAAGGTQYALDSGTGWGALSTLEAGGHVVGLSGDGNGSFWLTSSESASVTLRRYQTGWGSPTTLSSTSANPALPEAVDPHNVPVVWDDTNFSWLGHFDDAGPRVSLASPGVGTTLVGTKNLSFNVNDPGEGPGGVQRVDLYVDRGNNYRGFLGSVSPANGTATLAWNTTEADTAWNPYGTGGRLWPDGAYRVYAVAWDYSGHSTESARDVVYIAASDLSPHSYRPTVSQSIGGVSAAVNLYNGNLNLTQSDVSEPTVIGSLGVVRSYNSQDTTDHATGSGWRLSADTGVDIVFNQLIDHSGDVNYPSGTAEIDDVDGQPHYYLGDSANTYVPSIEDASHLQHNGDGTWSLTLADGTIYGFTSAGLVSSVTPLGTPKSFSHTYDGSGHLTAIGEPTGRSITLDYVSGHASAVHDFTATRTWSYAYTGTDLTQVTAPGNLITTYGYDGSHHVTSITDPNNEVLYIDYDASGRVTQFRRLHNGSVFTTSIDYTNTSAPVVTSYRGNLPGCTGTCRNYYQTTYRMDSYGRLIGTDHLNPDGQTASTSIHYDQAAGLADGALPRNLVTSSTDALGRVTSTVYDAMGDPISVTTPSGTSKTNYDEGYTGLSAEYFNNQNMTPASGYPVRRLDSTIDFSYSGCTPNGGTCSPDTSILGAGWSARWTGYVEVPTDGTYTFTTANYDDGVRLEIDGQELVDDWNAGGARTKSGTISLSAGAHAIDLQYFQATGPASLTLEWAGPGISTQAIPTANLKPGLGLTTSETSATGRKHTYTYDGPTTAHKTSDTLTNTDLDGATSTIKTTYSYIDPATGTTDAYGRLHAKTMPNGAGAANAADYTTVYAYYSNGATATDPCSGAVTNQGGALKTETTGTSGAITPITHYYDDRGLQTTKTDGNGNTCMTYDAAGRLASSKAPDRSTATTYAYDNDGNQTRVADPVAGTSTYAFDDMNRLTSATDVYGGTPTTYTYDTFTATTEQTTRTDPAQTVTETYDQSGRQIGTDANPNGGTTTHYSYGYNLGNDLTSTTYPNGLGATRTYDSSGRLSDLNYSNAGGKTLADFPVTYDADSRVTSQGSNQGDWLYHYDTAGRLDRVKDALGYVRRYQFDANSNRVEEDTRAGLHWAKGTTTLGNGIGTPLVFGDNSNGYSDYGLPFTFPFYGQSLNTIRISVHGYILMTGASSAPANPTIATTQGIFPLARDFKLGTGSITTEPVPTINPTKVLIRWKVQDPNAAATDVSNYTEFGVWLYNDGRMSYAYGNLTTPNGAHVGFSNGDGLNYANIGSLEQRGGTPNGPSIEVTPHSAAAATSSYDAYDRLSPDSSHTYDAAGNTKTLPGNQSFEVPPGP